MHFGPVIFVLFFCLELHSSQTTRLLSLFSKIQVSLILLSCPPLTMVFTHLGDPQRVKLSRCLQLYRGSYCDLGPN